MPTMAPARRMAAVAASGGASGSRRGASGARKALHMATKNMLDDIMLVMKCPLMRE